MLRGLLPKEYAFFDIFEKLTSLNKQMGLEFMDLLEGRTRMDQAADTIRQLERQSDETTRMCTDLLHRTFITPIDREDIYHLAKALDAFGDNINAATFRLANYGITEIRGDLKDFGKIINLALLEMEQAVHGLRHMKQHEIIRKHCQRIHELENQADDTLRKAVSSLFQQNDTMLLLKWKEIYERLEKAVDRIERTASLIETILIDNA